MRRNVRRVRLLIFPLLYPFVPPQGRRSESWPWIGRACSTTNRRGRSSTTCGPQDRLTRCIRSRRRRRGGSCSWTGARIRKRARFSRPTASSARMRTEAFALKPEFSQERMRLTRSGVSGHIVTGRNLVGPKNAKPSGISRGVRLKIRALFISMLFSPETIQPAMQRF